MAISAKNFMVLIAVALMALILARCSAGSKLFQSLTVEIDPSIFPPANPVPGSDNSVSRPVAAVTDGSGVLTSFVENELIVVTDDPKTLARVLAGWHGTLVRSFMPRDFGIKAQKHHLVRIDTNRADTSQLVSDLKRLSPALSSRLRVSSRAGLALLATASHAANAGLQIGINFIMGPTGYAERITTEDPAPSCVPTPSPSCPSLISGESFSPNPWNWSYFKRGGVQDIGTGDAWRALAAAGRLNNKTKIAVIDGGFMNNGDFPSDWEYHSNSVFAQDASRPNEYKCNGSPCRWHGSNVVDALMGVPDNRFGAAGPAGPVAKAVAIRLGDPFDLFNYLGAFGIAGASGARIVNMSVSGRIPAVLAWAVQPLDSFTGLMRREGVLFLASAGNNTEDVDAEDCAWPFDWPCWEKAWFVPCENDGVTCIGALDGNSKSRKPNSNWGAENVDLFGPGFVWVGPDLDNQQVHAFTATSAATPFVAGVAALVQAANPALGADDIERILLETAHPSPDGSVKKYVNAYAAVVRALGSTPPEISITVNPTDQPGFVGCGPDFRFKATVFDPDPGKPTVTWQSDIAGNLGTGEELIRSLPAGTHKITATATDPTGFTNPSNEVAVTVSLANARRPDIAIVAPRNHEVFTTTQPIMLELSGFDPGTGNLVSNNVRWVSLDHGVFHDLDRGQKVTVHLTTEGPHYINAYYKPYCGGYEVDDQRLIQVVKRDDNPPNMIVLKPSSLDIALPGTGAGEYCMDVSGFGYDEEDHDFVAPSSYYWLTNRSDLGNYVLAWDQNAHICLLPDPAAVSTGRSTVHEIRLIGYDKKGNKGISQPVKVSLLPIVR